MGLIKDSANKFVSAMNSSKAELESVQTTISSRKTEVENIIKGLKDNISNAVKSISSNGSEDIKNVLNNTIENLSDFINVSNKEIIEASKGMKFIEEFEKTFIVSIFGKVKAGKSYLGNFIMGNSFRKYMKDTLFSNLNDISVTVYDRGKQTTQNSLNVLSEDDSKGFKVGSTETTSTIQWFSIGGLSWFDTPGIGSITLDNENLAKEYVRNSDLVIFVCNSDAAGTRQEFEEMKELADMNKPILLMVTMSDTYEEDVDDDGNLIQTLQPKSQKDREDVENYMIETIRKNDLEKILRLSEILTVSTKLANEAIKKNDEELYKASNMDKLFKKLIDITCNEAAKMKLNNPKDRLNKMISNIIGNGNTANSLQVLKLNINSLCSGFISNKKETQKMKYNIIEEIKNTCNIELLKLVSKLKKDMDNGKRSISSNEIGEEVMAVLNNVINSVCSKELSKIVGNFNANTSNLLKNKNLNISDMKVKTDSVTYKETYVEKVRRPPRGLLEKAGSFFLGIEYHETKTRTETRTNTFDIGDNSSQITAEILNEADSIISNEADKFVNDIIEGYYKPIESVREIILREIDKTIIKLEGLKL